MKKIFLLFLVSSFIISCSKDRPAPLEIFYSDPIKSKKNQERKEEDDDDEKKNKPVLYLTNKEYKKRKQYIYQLEKKSKVYYSSYKKNKNINYLKLAFEKSNRAIFSWLQLQNKFNSQSKQALESLLERKRACQHHQELAQSLYLENVQVGNLESRFCFYYLN